MTDSNNFDNNKAWFEDGIIFTHLEGVLNLQGVIDIQEKVHKLIVDNSITVAPIICDLTQVDDTSTEANLAGLGKIVMAFNTMKHLSGIWVVGAGENVRKSAAVMNKFFLNNKMKFEDDPNNAKIAAQELIATTDSIVDNAS
ncbi:MAG: hypothetical protein KIH63_002230 [Candidatus Saccharibacteria bacterium]|nr:hypothetical protein [Candidatus Saccharibacteria bacterium]